MRLLSSRASSHVNVGIPVTDGPGGSTAEVVGLHVIGPLCMVSTCKCMKNFAKIRTSWMDFVLYISDP